MQPIPFEKREHKPIYDFLTRQVTACYTCGESIFQIYPVPPTSPAKQANVQYMQCQSCGLVLQSPTMTDEGLKEYYSGSAYRENTHGQGMPTERNYQEQIRRGVMVARDLRELITKYTLDGIENYLDIGGSLGVMATYILTIASNVKNAWIIEPSVDYARVAKSFGFGVFDNLDNWEDTHASRMDSVLDLITVVHVLEHLGQPREYIERLLSVADEGCVLYIRVPSLEYHHAARWVNHLTAFTAVTLVDMVERAGWKIKNVREDEEPPFDITLLAVNDG